MALLPIVKIGHPVLRKKADGVKVENSQGKDFQQFLDDMVETMHKTDGVGLAANQVGVSLQVFVLEYKPNPRYPEGQANA